MEYIKILQQSFCQGLNMVLFVKIKTLTVSPNVDILMRILNGIYELNSIIID